jgi:hypothetical protein
MLIGPKRKKERNLMFGSVKGTKQFMTVEVLMVAPMFDQIRGVVYYMHYLAGIRLSDDDKHHREMLFSTADKGARYRFPLYCDTGDVLLQKLPGTTSDLLDDRRIALIQFYNEQQADLDHGSHESF